MSPDDMDSLSVASAPPSPHARRRSAAIDRPHAIGRPSPGGFTLVEILVAVTIIAILATIAVVATRAALDSARKSTAKATMRMMMVAIEEYSRFWPAPKFPAWRALTAGKPITGTPRATAGFPEWDCSYLWDSADPTGLVYQQPRDPNVNRFEANECLAYSLLADAGGGPYLKDPPDGLVQLTLDLPDDPGDYQQPTSFQGRYGFPGTDPVTGQRIGTGVPLRWLVDPWGTPYRYQWMAGTTAITESNEVGNIADGVSLTTAGPDGFFGDPGGTDLEKQRTQDNLTLTGP